jgi:signal transduction histidine kinase
LDSNLDKLSDTQKEYLIDVHDSGKHLLSLVNDLLDLSKIEAGKQKVDLSEVNLRELPKNSMVAVEDMAAKHRIQLSLNMDGVPEVIKSDERALKQTMDNLLSNALKFTEDQGLVTISAKMVGCYTRPGRRSGDPESFQIILDPMSNERQSGATYQKCVEIAVF